MSVEGFAVAHNPFAGVARTPADLAAAPDLIDLLPIGIYACDAQGRVLWFNQYAERFWGRAPAIGSDAEKYCGSYKLYFDGRPITREETPMAQVIRTGEPIGGLEGMVERPDGTAAWAMVQIAPVKDAAGTVIGAINCFHETTALHRTPVHESLERRIEEQTALFEFTEKLQRATRREDVYNAALDAISRALRCPRASILIFDRGGVMRFVACRGLSKSYCRAVEGHSPWTRDTKDPQPLCIDDVDQADLGEELTRTVKAEGIGALAFIPLLESGRLIGKFMVYYDAPHRFLDAEIDLALTIARDIGFSIERVRASVAANRLAAIVASSDDAIVSKDINGVIMTWNGGAERIFGYTADEVIGKPVTILMPPERIDEEPGILARIRAGESIDHYETVRRRKDGTRIDISLTVSPIRDALGRVVGASKIARDITERKRAEEAVKKSERRLAELLAAIPAAIYTTTRRARLPFT